MLKKAGDRVSSGEIIGYTGGENAPGQDKNLFEFELWHNGTPVDRRIYRFRITRTRENTTSGG